MTDLWSWIAAGLSVGGGGLVAREIIRAFTRWRDRRAQQRQEEIDTASALRDELRQENAGMRAEIRALRDEVNGVIGQLRDCEERSAGMERELALRAGHAVQRERRISALEDKVARLEGQYDG